MVFWQQTPSQATDKTFPLLTVLGCCFLYLVGIKHGNHHRTMLCVSWSPGRGTAGRVRCPGAPTGAVLGSQGDPRRLPLGTRVAGFCHHLVETRSCDQAQAEEDIWGHTLLTYCPCWGVCPGLVTRLAWFLRSNICLPAPGSGSWARCPQGTSTVDESLLCKKL